MSESGLSECRAARRFRWGRSTEDALHKDYATARKYLERAVLTLPGDGPASEQLRTILDRTISLLDEFEARTLRPPRSNVVTLESLRRARQMRADALESEG